MSEDTKLQQLIINTLSPEQMPEVLSETEIYLVEDDVEYATVEELATKQDVINDLATIRDGASKGATALQSVPDTYALKTYVQNYHDNTKQDILTAGSAIGIDNNEVAVKLFDRSKFTVVGTLAITDDGILDGTNQTEYGLNLKRTIDGSNGFELGFDFEITDVTLTTNPWFFSSTNGNEEQIDIQMYFQYANIYVGFVCLDENGMKTEIIMRDSNKPFTVGKYKFVCGYDLSNTSYYYKFFKDDSLLYENSITSSYKLNKSTHPVLFGTYANNYRPNSFSGIADLKTMYINDNGVEVFNGNQTIYKALETSQTRYVVAKSDKSLLPSWWVVYNDGWGEQGGNHTFTANNSKTNIALTKSFNNIEYYIFGQGTVTDSSNTNTVYVLPNTVNEFTLGMYGKAQKVYWKACGYLAEGEY